MSKDLSVSVLMDFYGELLTEKQRDTMDLYYNQDYSLAEIAQNIDISRQGVRDFIKRGEKQLDEFEEKLGIVRKYNLLKQKVEEVEKLFVSTKENDIAANKAEILKKLEEIKEII